MQDSQLIMNSLNEINACITVSFKEIQSQFYNINTQLKELYTSLGSVNARLDGIIARLDGVDARLDGVDARLDGMDARLDGIDLRLDNMDKQIIGLRNDMKEMEARLIADMDFREFGLNQEIDNVYSLALENHDNIEILLIHKDNILSANAAIFKIPVLEERQDVTEQVVQSHSSALRELRSAIMT